MIITAALPTVRLALVGHLLGAEHSAKQDRNTYGEKSVVLAFQELTAEQGDGVK